MIDAIPIVSFVWNGFKKLRAFRKRPRLEVYFDANECYHDPPIEGDRRGFFCHVIVRNTGKATARKCKGRLIQVEIIASGRLVRHPEFNNPVLLKWSYEPNFDPKDIESDIPCHLDVCYARESNPEILSFFCPKHASGNRTDFPHGVYIVTIRCDGERLDGGRLKHKDAKFLIRHQGAWNEIAVESFDAKKNPGFRKLTNIEPDQTSKRSSSASSPIR